MELRGKKVIFLGDSITEGMGTSCCEARYTEVLKRQAGIAEIRNYGIIGTRIARQQHPDPQKLKDYEAFTERFEQMENDADVIVVFGGTNDYGHGDAPFGSFEDRTIDTFCGAVHVLMRGLIQKYPTAEICFITPLHRENENQPNQSNGLPLKAYVEKICETAAYYSLPVLNLYQVAGICPDIPGQKEAFCPDGLHPNDMGHQRIADKLQKFLEQL